MKILEPKIHRLLHKVAVMMTDNVPQKEIAEAVGVSEGRISQLKEDEKFNEVLTKAQVAKLQQYEEMDDTWDVIELMAIKKLKNTLRTFNDPDLALKIAAVANKAQRKSSSFNKPVSPMNGGRIELTLSQNFIDARSVTNVSPIAGKISNKSEDKKVVEEKSGEKEATKPLQKIVDILAPAAVERMLLPAKNESFSPEILTAMVNSEMEE